MFEHRQKPLLSHQAFLYRMSLSLLLGVVILAPVLVLGMMGYHFFEHLSWLDAFASAAMILSGMGPLAPLQTDFGKLFAGCYALFSGLVFITVTGILLAPIAHRVLHKFHLEADKKGEAEAENLPF